MSQSAICLFERHIGRLAPHLSVFVMIELMIRTNSSLS